MRCIADVVTQKDIADLRRQARRLEYPLIADRDDIVSYVFELWCKLPAEEFKPSTINMMARQARWRLLRDSYRDKRHTDTIQIDAFPGATEHESQHQLQSMVVHAVAETIIYFHEILTTLMQLPTTWQRIVELSVLGYSAPEIAKELGVGLRTVERRLTESRRIITCPEKLL
jgi:DNA-directed RNA polymerase specialized sigma24 family protein